MEKDKISKKSVIQKLIVGIPGSGKSYYINEKYLHTEEGHNKTSLEPRYYKRVVFYDGYDYSEFIGGFRPSYEKGKATMKFVKGPFLDLLESALRDKQHEYFLIIEEINRGNAPLIFGDFFQLLDRDNDQTSDTYGFSTYSIRNKDIEDNLNEVDVEEGIRLPSNFNIIGTMNTSDQNTFPLDTAFKHRFEIEYFVNKWDCIKDDVTFFGNPWNQYCLAFNEFIINVLKLPEDKQMGPFFVCEDDNVEEKVINYLYDDIAIANGSKDSIFKKNINKDDIFKNIYAFYSGKSKKFNFENIFSEELMNYLPSVEDQKVGEFARSRVQKLIDENKFPVELANDLCDIDNTKNEIENGLSYPFFSKEIHRQGSGKSLSFQGYTFKIGGEEFFITNQLKETNRASLVEFFERLNKGVGD